MQRAASILACFIFCVNCFSQQYPFVHYTPREGLANNRARFIFQDSKGILYISTFAGLSVYDGTRFITYNTKSGLATELVNDMAEMGEDSIWVFPNTNKINCLVNGRLKDFIPDDKYIPLINQFIKCSNGNYYAIADEGLFRLENKRFIKLPFTGIPDEEARIFLQATEIDHKLYILSNPGYKRSYSNLLVYDLDQNKVLAHDKNIQAISMFKPSKDELWFSTVEGMLMLNKSKLENKTISLTPLPDSFHIPKNLFPNFMFRDRQDNTWLACTKGVYKVDKDGRSTIFTTENGLTTNSQISIFQDSENNIWFTNEQTGLCKLTNQQLAFYPEIKPGFTTTDIFIHPSNDSVFLYDAHHHKIMLELPNDRFLEYYSNDSLDGYTRFVSANGNYLFGGRTIFHWSIIPNSNKYSVSTYYTDDSTGMGFTCGLREKNGSLVAVSSNLVLINGDKISSEPVNYLADQLTLDNSNKIWVATRSNQLFCFEISGAGADKKLSLLKKFDSILPGSSPRSVVADKSGNIWIGSRDWGLYCFHFDANLNLTTTRQVTSQNGLSENFIYYLFCDNDNNIWACTPSGLDRIKIDKDNFLVENVTRSNNIYLPILKIQQTAKGLFWILTSAGVITYDPNKKIVSDWKPHLSFSDILINNSNKISLSPSGELKYFQNNLLFHLSAPTFIDEKQTRFSYLLEGSGNEEWSSPSPDASINFVRLPPGDYTLRAKAIFLHGRYPAVESAFSFRILPPWWLTWWFKSLLALVVIGLFLLALRSYINRKLELQRGVLERKQAIEKERTRIATDMHDDLGAGLSQIKFLSEAIGMKRQKHLPIEEEVSSIRSFSDEMIDKMGEIVWALNEKNDTLSDLLSYTRSYAVEYLAQHGIKCRVEEPDTIPQDYVSSEFRRNVYLTVKESLHNIVKHAQATEVFIKIAISNWLIIQIRDNGIGINNSPKNSWGNGLASMNNRVSELKGDFKIENMEGTLITIKVPLNH